ncbi:hypothetical protein H6P81_003499 [Aristolochia fimbriata]|uniref:Germin-like protein n=1 Tax=Aristolochia fimbriata TaxID=158543 RepID=A0AAV7FDT6_ARIFI|nr:hypothetical protein H6P81_003499 [Aristolochia fimbriata]
MAYLDQKQYLWFFLFVVATLMGAIYASDPDLISDFLVPPNATNVDGNFFTYTGFRALAGGDPVPKAFAVTKATKAEFPALDGQSVSYAVLAFPPNSINPPHTHPRSGELLLLISGALDVGFVDTAGKLFTQTLQAGDMFVFPKGLVHYQVNCDAVNPAWALSAFGSASAGTVSVPSTLFATGIDDNVLAMSFKTDVATIQKIKAAFAP